MAAAQTTVVTTPSSSEPPKASSRASTGAPASRPSSHSMAGTSARLPATAAPTNPRASGRRRTGTRMRERLMRGDLAANPQPACGQHDGEESAPRR